MGLEPLLPVLALSRAFPEPRIDQWGQMDGQEDANTAAVSHS